MKVYIGPYRDWIGPYQIADWLQKVGVSEDNCHKIGKWLADTWLMKFCQLIHHYKGEQKVKIRIDGYDVWSMDYTLSKIISPMLKKLQEIKHGAPYTDDNDVPDGIGLRSTEAPPFKEEYGETDDNLFKRWDWILAEMIWAFEQIESGRYDTVPYKLKEEDRKRYYDRLQNGFNLFGKYYMNLWD